MFTQTSSENTNRRVNERNQISAILNDPDALNRVIQSVEDNFFNNREKYNGCFTGAVREFLSKNAAIAVVERCSQCTCCERHQHNRPETIEWTDTAPQPLAERQEYECKCGCRQFSRWVCRAYKK